MTRRWQLVLASIEKEKEKLKAISDIELQNKTTEYKNRLQNGETLEHLLPEAFAAVSEACKRALGLIPFAVQFYGGYILHCGNVAEMKTGEGKTLVAVLPAYLNALTGKGVHVITVNEYLAQRDANQTQKIMKYLGLTVGCVLSEMDKSTRKEQYNRDITYITNNEAGFDYLRDNMRLSDTEKAQRGLIYAIIDEVDSVLIDEARTPLIIAGAKENNTELFIRCCKLVSSLKKGELKKFSKIECLGGETIEESGDYMVDEKEKTVKLTEEGTKKAESFFEISNLADTENNEVRKTLLTTLRAYTLMQKDKDYIVRDGQIYIVDEFTGRVMDGRRFSEGLHQAIEAKENVKIKQESVTLGTITFQNFFQKYEKIAGMTGTAKTEEKEFKTIYGMRVIQVPTNKPITRIDQETKVFKTKEEKAQAVIEEIKETHKKGQPILVGTADIESSAYFSEKLKELHIRHTVLNAKNDAAEAEIIAKAGQLNAVTIATNMAGRGTDIKLSPEARKQGGLKVIGTEHYESRRIDNQLRGRSGRQGDCGQTRFFVSMEDPIFKEYPTKKPLLSSKDIQKAQKKMEDTHFGIRKSILEFDSVNDEQREELYAIRNQVLQEENTDSFRKAFTLRFLNTASTDTIKKTFKNLILPNTKKLKKAQAQDLFAQIEEEQTKKTESIPKENMDKTYRYIFLRILDKYWTNHITKLEQLRHQISFYGYGQKDPKIEYRKIAYDLWDEMVHNVMEETINSWYHLQTQ